MACFHARTQNERAHQKLKADQYSCDTNSYSHTANHLFSFRLFHFCSTTQPAPHLDKWVNKRFFFPLVSFFVIYDLCVFDCSIHVVFGHVVSGHDLVRQLEQLPVDRNSRPLQDAVISNCGELVRQVKGKWLFPHFWHGQYPQWELRWLAVKKVKKAKKAKSSSSEESSAESSHDEDKKKKKKQKKKHKKKSGWVTRSRCPSAFGQN